MLAPERLARLTETAHFVDELLNRTPNPAQPYVGKHAFAHKAGLHAAGVRSDANTFEHVDPEVVGNSRDLLISELSGKGAIVEKARSAGIEADEEFVQRVLSRVKELEHEGFQFEAADGSFELLMRREQDRYESLFRLESWRVTVEKHADGNVETEASIRVWKDGRRYWAAAEGNGPVNALDKALRKAIGDLYPALSNIELVNFKVRILDELKGTGAVTRVLIDASDGHDVWGSIGVSENVIGASWDALLDSLEYGLSHRPAPGAPATDVRRRRRAGAAPRPRLRAPRGERDDPARPARAGRAGGARRGGGAPLRPAVPRPATGAVRAGLRRAARGRARERGQQRHDRSSPGPAGGRA